MPASACVSIPVPDRAALAHYIRQRVETALGGRVSAGFVPHSEPVERVSTGIAALDRLTGGMVRGGLNEFSGPASSGRTSVMLAALARAASDGETCCLVDVMDSFDPGCAAAAGVKLENVLWVRGGPGQTSPASCKAREKVKTPKIRSIGFAALEQALKVTDLVLQGGGFGMVVIDLCDVAPPVSHRIPLTSWFRFRRAVEKTSTVLLVMSQEPNAGTCASLIVKLEGKRLSRRAGVPESVISHARLLAGIQIAAESARERRQPQLARTEFNCENQWKTG